MFPITIGYSSGPCGLLKIPGGFTYMCSATYPTFIAIPLSLIDYFFYGYVSLNNLIIGIPIQTLINIFLSLIISYILNGLYHKFRKVRKK